MVSFGRKPSVEEATPESPEAFEQQVAGTAVAASSNVLGAFPRVNLIPDQIAAEAKVRKAKLTLGLAAGVAVLVVGGLYVMAAGQVGSAQEQLDVATAHSAALASEAAKYADVPKVRADLADAQAQQVAALGTEVRWSSVLTNLGLTIPTDVSLTSLQANINGASAAVAGAAADGTGSPVVTSMMGNPGIGSIQYVGEATGDPKLASFLESLSKNPGLIDPFATQAAASTDGGPLAITFTASATINQKALSHRFDAKGN
jgi:Tfp pilus assembly protein PilN